jgi:hypothetical protein
MHCPSTVSCDSPAPGTPGKFRPTRDSAVFALTSSIDTFPIVARIFRLTQGC